MPVVEVNSTTLFHDSDGDGPACLVLHGGLGVDHTLYRSLARLGSRMRLTYFDQRCNGRSGRPPLDTLTMEQLADDADALCEKLGLGPVTALGHSYGGFVAQELVLRHPARVSRMLLVGTTPGQLGTNESPSEAEQGAPPRAELVEILSDPPSTQEAFAVAMPRMLELYLHRATPDALRPFMDTTIFEFGAFARSMEVLDSWSSVDRLGSVGVPVLLVVGRHDVACSPPQSYRIGKRVQDGRVVVLEESGHIPWIDEPDAFYSAVEDWLDRT